MWFRIQPKFHEWAIFIFIVIFFDTSELSPIIILFVYVSAYQHKSQLDCKHICVCDNIVLHTEFSFFLKDDTGRDTLTRQATAIMLTAREKHHLSQVCLYTTLLHLFNLWLC